MARQIELPFAAKTASELASQLGVSKKRQKRIFAIVEKQPARSPASGMLCTSRAQGKSRARKKSSAFTSRPRSRSNAKAAR
jgi:hypothetical protein